MFPHILISTLVFGVKDLSLKKRHYNKQLLTAPMFILLIILYIHLHRHVDTISIFGQTTTYKNWQPGCLCFVLIRNLLFTFTLPLLYFLLLIYAAKRTPRVSCRDTPSVHTPVVTGLDGGARQKIRIDCSGILNLPETGNPVEGRSSR